jgi:hypothetical protein
MAAVQVKTTAVLETQVVRVAVLALALVAVVLLPKEIQAVRQVTAMQVQVVLETLPTKAAAVVVLVRQVLQELHLVRVTVEMVFQEPQMQ